MTGFQEQQNLTLSSPLSLNISSPGMVSNFTTDLSPGTVAAGATINSFFLNGGFGSETHIDFSLSTDQTILGLIVTKPGLDATDGTVGVITTSYPTGFAARGYENDGDSLTLSADRHTLSGHIDVTTFSDELRIITTPCQTPTISGASASPNVLWPPDHTLIPVTVNYTAAAGCSASPNCALTVSSNEPLNGTGDGDTSPDWYVVDAHHLLLRAERAGTGTGRVYTITITCTDPSGLLSSSAVVTVKVPISQS